MINDVVNGGFQPKVNLTPPQGNEAPAAVPALPAKTEQANQQSPAADPSQLQKAVSKLNDYVQNSQRKLSFSVSAETGRTIIKVYDAETDELIRQIPPEETIKLAENLDTTSTSLFVKERA